MSSTPSASLDLGTNSTRFLMLSSPDSGFSQERILDRDSVVTRLGEGIESSGRLSDSAMERVIEQVEAYNSRVREQEGDWVDAIATHACREAPNGDRFLSRLEEILSIPPRVISGPEEARLIYRGVRASLSNHKIGRVMDIGGGSTEWILNQGGEIEYNSFPVGVVTLTELFLTGNEWDPEMIAQARKRIRSRFPGVRGEGDLVVVGGTGTTLAAMKLELDKYDSAAVHGERLTLAEIERFRNTILDCPVDQLIEHPMIQPGREDVMMAGVVILEEFARFSDVNYVIVSDFGPLAGTFEEIRIKRG